MNSKFWQNKKVIFFVFFALVVLAAKNINFSSIIGEENQFFTLFQFFGPITGKFLGTTVGVASVLVAELASVLITGKELTVINLLRLTPMLFATYYFSSKKRLTSALIPAACMVLFIMHPVGREAWPFTLYWLIPILGRILPNNVRGRWLLQSFGATFTAHAVGSTLWLYTVSMTSAQWLALIPIVAFERLLFGGGIACSVVFTNAALSMMSQKLSIPQTVLNVETKMESDKQKEAIKIRA